MKRDILRLSVLLAFMIAGFSACQDDELVTKDISTESTSGELIVQALMEDGSVYFWDGQGSDSELCDKLGEGDEGQRPPTGWMHWLFNNKGESTNAQLVLYRGDEVLGIFEPQAPLNANNWHFYTPFFEIFDDEERTLKAEVRLDNDGANPELVVLSDYCPGVEKEELTVTKTVVTSFTREHFWDIDKKVETEKGHELDDVAKIWLYIDGSGNEKATWTVDVTYDDYEDSKFNVSGVITIKNTGTLDAVITSVVDELADKVIGIVWVDENGDALDPQPSFPYTLEPGKTLTGTYSEDVESKIEGFNEVTVKTERDEYSDDVEIIWGDPTTEINKTVKIEDISDLFGKVDLGTVTAPNDGTYTYTYDFAWADYGADDCGSFTYDNTATIVETEQSADATLKVNVQCFVYETAYAKGDPNDPFCNHFSQWGWTNPIEPGTYTWDLWAGAAQCDISKGTLVGTVDVVYDGNGVTVTFNLDDGYDLKETHVYAGYDMFPKDRRGRDTVAPGQYTNDGPFEGEIYVIVHAVVGVPDPDFGPEE